MRERKEITYEPGLIMIFRLFCGAVAIVCYFFSANPPFFYRIPLSQQVWGYMGLSYTAVFIYLIIPKIQKFCKSYFLPAAIVATILIPILGLSWQPYFQGKSNFEMSTISSYSISILLMFPLIITAWQYNFKIVILFFVIIGGFDSLIYLLILGPKDPHVGAALYASLTRIVTFVAIGFIITELMKNQRERQQKLVEMNKKLKQQAHYARELSTTRERNRLAHELHDVLAHTLSSLAVQLEAMKATMPSDPEHSLELLDKALKNTRGGLKETRRSLKDLRAQPLEELGFQLAIHKLIEDAEHRGGFKVALTYEPIAHIIDYANEHSLYRIIQEAMENIIRHAEATDVFMSFTTNEKKEAVLTIRDNGKGFDQSLSDPTRHFGISTMEERAAAIGTTFSIESKIHQGTLITIGPGERHD